MRIVVLRAIKAAPLTKTAVGPNRKIRMRYPERIVTGQQVDEAHQKRARQLRREMTAEESLLWQRLRANRLDGLHFRRQQVIHGFIVDFYCHAAGLVVEMDGEGHAYQETYDQERDQILASSGVRILRISNHAVLHSLEEVFSSIRAICREELESHVARER